MRKERWAIVVGNSLLSGTEGPLCWTDPLCREGCCLLAAWAEDIPGKALGLVQPLGYYPLLLLHVGNDKAAACCPRTISEIPWFVREFRSQLRAAILEGNKREWWEIMSVLQYPWGKAHGMLCTSISTTHGILGTLCAASFYGSVLATGTWFQLNVSPAAVCFSHARTGPLQSPLRKFYLHPLEQSRIYILVRLLSGVSLEGQAWINYLNEKHRTNGFTEVFSTGIKCITITRKIIF